jgi:hypothetical protein
MNPKAMEPYGAAHRTYFEGDASAQLVIRRDDGLEVPMPVSHFFREPSAFTPIEKSARFASRLPTRAKKGLFEVGCKWTPRPWRSTRGKRAGSVRCWCKRRPEITWHG